MKTLDTYWAKDKKWYYSENGVIKIREDAPEEVKESFEHFLKQLAESKPGEI